MVHKIQGVVITKMKELLGEVGNVEYFTHGCVGQYKNYKSFYNICKHREEFGVWHQ